jgi:hypothetical protein
MLHTLSKAVPPRALWLHPESHVLSLPVNDKGIQIVVKKYKHLRKQAHKKFETLIYG